MERLRYSPHNRQNLVRWLLDKDTPRGPDPRQWVGQADMYQEKYGHDDEIEQGQQIAASPPSPRALIQPYSRTS
jgi:hypothetical protein